MNDYDNDNNDNDDAGRRTLWQNANRLNGYREIATRTCPKMNTFGVDGHVYAICCRPEAGGDVISVENVKIEGCPVLNCEVASFNGLRDL